MFGHSALKPKEVGLVRLMPVIVLSEIEELKQETEDFLRAEFDDYLNILELESLEGLESYESLEKYKIHILRIYENKAELTFKSGKKILQEFEDLEEMLEKFGRELIYYYHKTNK